MQEKDRRGDNLYLKIDHVGIAVKSLASALRVYSNAFGMDVNHIEAVPDQKTRVGLIPVGESRLELLEATGTDSHVARFIEKRGEGIHHICLQVEDLEGLISRLKAEGIRMIDDGPRQGADGCLVAFVHPSSAGGVLFELSERGPAREPAES